MINNFIKPGLRKVCGTGRLSTGELKYRENPKHVIYVWIDALTNYITALGYGTENDEKYQKYRPADVHLGERNRAFPLDLLANHVNGFRFTVTEECICSRMDFNERWENVKVERKCHRSDDLIDR